MPKQLVQRDTWSDWFPDADTVEQATLDELIERYPYLRDRVNVTTVRYWQNSGVLPRPTRRWHDGATRALYPAPYAFMAMVHILELQEKGYTLPEIGLPLRRRFRVWNLRGTDYDTWEHHAQTMAAEYTKATGNTINQVRIAFIDQDGEEDSYFYDVENEHPLRDN